ncbi:MAG: KamA family radical SAM protein [Syntrophales bacterium]|nr:KamA family radical SAM protein [Syntrophales bacterium]
MEEDPLFSEEVEPPGSAAGPQGLENPRDKVFFSSGALFHPPAFPLKPASRSDAFQESPRSRAFRKRFFPQTTLHEWQDWRWQLRNRITDADNLAQIIRFSEMERRAAEYGVALPLAITPYYASLLDSDDDAQPLRRTVVPALDECAPSSGEKEDPLEEERDSPVPGIVHRYPDRVLFLVTRMCSTYCRYCTRSRMVGHNDVYHLEVEEWERGIAYIASNPAVRDVLLSGGDPLTLTDEKLDWLLSRLRMIPHVEILRIGTKVPAVMPQRITPALIRLLKRFHPLWISIHATHPDELTPEMTQACNRLADAGIPLGSQTVLLAGVNDDVETMKRLMQGLLRLRIKPYYLYQCDPIPGSSHFRTPVAKGLEIIRGLRGYTTGYAVPTYVIDAPGGGGKIPLLPEYLLGRDGDDLIIRNYAGKLYRYPDGIQPRGEVH